MTLRDDHRTNTEHQAARHLDAYHGQSRDEWAFEHGYDPCEDYRVQDDPEARDLYTRGKRIAADAADPDSPLHDAAVAEAAAIRAAGWSRMAEGLGLRWGAELFGEAATCSHCGAPTDVRRSRAGVPLCGSCFANRTANELDGGAA